MPIYIGQLEWYADLVDKTGKLEIPIFLTKTVEDQTVLSTTAQGFFDETERNKYDLMFTINDTILQDKYDFVAAAKIQFNQNGTITCHGMLPTAFQLQISGIVDIYYKGGNNLL